MAGLEKNSVRIFHFSSTEATTRPYHMHTDFGMYNCSNVIEIEGEDVVHSPGQAKGEGVRGEGEMEGR